MDKLLDKSRTFHRNGSEGSVRNDIIKGRFSEAVILSPHPLQMEVNRHELQLLGSFVRTFAEIRT